MSTSRYFKKLLNSKDINRIVKDFTQVYINKYYDAFCSQFDIEGLSYGYLKTFRSKLYSKGSVWIRKDSITGEPIVCDYAGASYDWNNLPVTVQLVTTHNAPQSIIPTSLQVVDKDGVIVWCRPCEKGFNNDINYYIGKLGEAETLITVNLYLQRCPWILTSESENYPKLKEMLMRIFSDEPAIITDIDKNELDHIELSTPWITDKLTEYEERLENKLKTLLGMDNQGGYLNREQQNLDTTNSNNQEINNAQNSLLDTLQNGIDRANEVLGLNLKLKRKVIAAEQMSETKEGVGRDEIEEDDE